MAELELETTYLSLDGHGQVARHPVEGFWETIDTNNDVLGTLVAAIVSTEDWPHWEMHPEGEEVIVLIDGRMSMILDEPGGARLRGANRIDFDVYGCGQHENEQGKARNQYGKQRHPALVSKLHSSRVPRSPGSRMGRGIGAGHSNEFGRGRGLQSNHHSRHQSTPDQER
jgi:hypothetical protein